MQAQIFGELSSSPELAEQQAKAVLQSPQWQVQEQQLAMVYRAVVRAWELDVKKVPAVVFDEQDVVYGTADIARARALPGLSRLLRRELNGALTDRKSDKKYRRSI